MTAAALLVVGSSAAAFALTWLGLRRLARNAADASDR